MQFPSWVSVIFRREAKLVGPVTPVRTSNNNPTPGQEEQAFTTRKQAEAYGTIYDGNGQEVVTVKGHDLDDHA